MVVVAYSCFLVSLSILDDVSESCNLWLFVERLAPYSLMGMEQSLLSYSIGKMGNSPNKTNNLLEYAEDSTIKIDVQRVVSHRKQHPYYDSSSRISTIVLLYSKYESNPNRISPFNGCGTNSSHE